RGGRHVDDHVDLVDVDPLPRDAGADVGFVLMVGAHDLDLESLLGHAEILDRHPRGDDRARAGDVGVKPRHVVQDADLGHVVGLRLCRAAGEDAGKDGKTETTFHAVPPWVVPDAGTGLYTEILVKRLEPRLQLGVGELLDHFSVLHDVVTVRHRRGE